MAAGIFGNRVFNNAIFNTGTSAASANVGGGSNRGSKPWEQKWRQELVDLLEEKQLKPVSVPTKVVKAIERAIEEAPPDDSTAIKALRSQLEQVRISYKPHYLEALRYEVARRHLEYMEMMERDDEEVILLLH